MAARTVEVRRSALVAHPAARLFAIIEAAEDYPAFLPWCGGATILERTEQVVAARIQIAWRGVRFSFVTRNPKRAPEWMAIGLEEGPFRRFEGQWHLTPLAEWGCRVEFTLAYEMNSAILSALAGPVFDHAVNTLVDAFIERADRVAAGLARVSTETPTAGTAAPPAMPASAAEPPSAAAAASPVAPATAAPPTPGDAAPPAPPPAGAGSAPSGLPPPAAQAPEGTGPADAAPADRPPPPADRGIDENPPQRTS